MSDFKGNNKITVLEEDDGLGYNFEVTVCSSTTQNDGAIPYGSFITAVDVNSFKTATADGRSLNGDVEVFDLIDGTPSFDSNVITVGLQYPSTSGYYRLQFICELNTGAIKELHFNRIVCCE